MTVLHSLGITLLLILALWVSKLPLMQEKYSLRDCGFILRSGRFVPRHSWCDWLSHRCLSIGYMRHEVAHGELSPVTLWITTVSSICFCSPCCWLLPAKPDCDVGGNRSHHLKLGVSGGIYGQRSSLEAAWKYIIICTLVSLLVCSVPCWYTPTPPAYAAGRNGDILERGS